MIKNSITIMLWMISLSISLSAQDATSNRIMTKRYDAQSNLVVWPAEFRPEESRWYVYNEIEIYAKPEVVWNILIEAHQWHTFYKGVQSPVVYLDSAATCLRNGLSFKMHTMGLHLVPQMKEFVPNERMSWEVRRRDLTAYHAWVIVPTATGCRLITPEAQNGFLTFLQRVFQPNKLLKLHDKWLKAIKDKAEKTDTL